jgi:Pyridoxamine 5'-phosphate oxidase
MMATTEEARPIRRWHRPEGEPKKGGRMSVRTPLDEQPLVEGGATPWVEARERLETPERDRTYWLATNGSDGRPHVRPLLGLWLDDAFYFITGVATRKGKNLEADPRCVIVASSQILPALDIVLEGDAVRVTDDAKIQRVADAYSSMLHWPLEGRDGAVFGPNAPTAGPPPYAVFDVAPTAVVGLPGIAGTEEGVGAAGSFSPTRWRF